jgi:TPR repeat protein
VDKARAAPWLRKASTHGIDDAHLVLGTYCRFGRGVPKDLVLAYAYYIRAGLANDDPRKLLRDLRKEKTTR